MLNRKEIFKRAIHDCYTELYAKAQPMADYDNLVAELKIGKIDEKKNGPIYERHYISKEESDYIVNKYIDAYGMTERWKSDVETIEDYLINGGSKNAYVDEFTDDNGKYHPGYRSYENVLPLKTQILNIMKEFDCSDAATEVAEKIYSKVMETIKSCKDFYKFDNEAESFRTAIYLGAAPTQDKETVKKWWKDNYNADIEIEDNIPELFWYYDNGYTEDEILAEYGYDNFEELIEKEFTHK